MFRVVALTLSLIFFASYNSIAQSTCSCSVGNGGCSASQSCPEGYIASCTCAASGCGSVCIRQDGPLPGGGDNLSVSTLDNADVKTLTSVLSNSIGRTVSFVPFEVGFRFDISFTDRKAADAWTILENLSQKGELFVNGQKFDILRGYRKTLIEGGEFRICAPGMTVRALLGELSFLTGRKFDVIAGDPFSKVLGTVQGDSLASVLGDLERQTGVRIAKN